MLLSVSPPSKEEGGYFNLIYRNEVGGVNKNCEFPSLLYFLSVFEPREAGKCFVWPMRQLFVPIPELNFYRCRKRRDPFPPSFKGANPWHASSLLKKFSSP